MDRVLKAGCAAVISLALVIVVAPGCGKKKDKKKKLSQQELCEKFISKRKAPIFMHGAKKNKKVFMDYCLKVERKYLVCDTEDRQEDCPREKMIEYQSNLNDLLVKGKIGKRKK